MVSEVRCPGEEGVAGEGVGGQREEGRGAHGSEWGGAVFCSACSLPTTLTSRLSPEVYLKRPAHSEDWRLDIMLKRKAVRSGWLWVGVDWKDLSRGLPRRKLGI